MTGQSGPGPSEVKERVALANELETHRHHTPTDLALAHELGSMYYVLATKMADESDIPCIAGYWTKVISNWAPVLEDDTYWQTWVEERAQAYGVTISPENAQAARERLWHLLLADLHRFDGKAEDSLPYHESLAIQMRLETTALRLLTQFAVLSDVGAAGVPLYGPLLLRELGQEQPLAQFIAGQVQRHGMSSSLLPMLRSLAGEAEEEELPEPDRLGQLMLSYSQLGGALVYVQQQQSAAAVRFLRHVQCEACSPLSTRATSAEGKRAIEICHADCPRFACNNPGYSELPDGWNRLWADTIRLAIEVSILGARDLLREEEPDYPEACSLWESALDLAWYDELKKEVRQRITDSIWGEVASLKQAGKWQRATEVLEAAEDVIDTENGQLVGQRLKLLEHDAVSKAKEGDWVGAASALRTAHRLNPMSDRICDNLLLAMEREADQLAAGGSHSAAREVLGEAERILKQRLDGEAQQDDPQRIEQLESFQFKLGFVYWEFWQQSPLFNRAIAEAKRLGQHYLGVEHLFLSLAKVEGGLTQQTLYQLGMAPVALRNEIRRYVGLGDDTEHWEHTHFTPRLRRVLLRAIEFARVRGTTALDESDFLYAVVREPDSAPLQTMMALHLPVEELPRWQAANPAPAHQFPPGATVFTHLSGPEDGKVAHCTRPIIAIGRAEENDIRLRFDQRVSRRHARLTVTDAEYTLEDLDSSGGTYLEWHIRVSNSALLAPGARFKVGQTWLRIGRR